MINFKQVKKDELADLAKLAHDIWFEFYPEILTLGQIYYMVNKFQSYGAIKDQIERENYYYYFINFNGKNVGYMGFAPKNDHIFLSKLYIQKEYRGKGFGHLAIEKIKKVAESNKYKRIELTVNKFNTNSVKAYEKWGFKIISTISANIGEGYYMDDHIMEYKIIKEA